MDVAYPDNFLRLPKHLSEYDTSRVVILPIPYEATTSLLGGCREGPRAILAVSDGFETFDEELLVDVTPMGIATLPPVEPHYEGPEPMVQRIAQATARCVKDGKFVFGIGGEHTVSVGLIQGLKDVFTRDFAVLQIDAHTDLRSEYQSTPYSHASVMRRIHEMGPCIVPVGIRAVSEPEYKYIQEWGLKVFYAHDIVRRNDWIDEVIACLPENVYVTVDVDGLDPAVIPGVGTPEPGGLSWYEVTALLRRVCESRRVIGADLVELRPIPGSIVSELAAARLIYKILTYLFAGAIQEGKE